MTVEIFIEIYIIPASEILDWSAHTKMPIFLLEKTPFPMGKKLDGTNSFQTKTAMKNPHFSQND
jgi:hypothetical protein